MILVLHIVVSPARGAGDSTARSRRSQIKKKEGKITKPAKGLNREHS